MAFPSSPEEGGGKLTKSVPSAFLLSKTSISLPELQWALENGIIGAQVVVDVASAMRADGVDSEQVMRLSALTRQDLLDVREILHGDIEAADIAAIRAKWVWLTVAWVYQQERDQNLLFDTIEELYADFGYPEEIVPFGPYAPAYQGRRDPNEVRQEVLRELQTYLAHGEARFGRR